MHLDHRIHLVAAVVAVAALTMAGHGAALAARMPQESVAPAPETAFGYEVGEERRYGLGPEDALRIGEYATWRILLVGIDGGAEDWVAEFELGHERSKTFPGAFGSTHTNTINIDVEGTLRVNAYGFPLSLVFVEKQSISGQELMEGAEQRIEYEFDGDRMVKKTHLGGNDYDFHIPIASHRDLDKEVPRGMYVFAGEGLACLNRIDGRRCRDGEPAFANPGLLDIFWPLLEEESDGKREVLLWKPHGFSGSPLGLIDVSEWVREERDMVRNRRRYYQVTKVTLGVSAEIDVGGRPMHSWELDVGRGLRKAYVDPAGKVLRIDLERSPDRPEDRWIRLLFPSEY